MITEKSFLEDVAAHAMKIVRADGVYRHLTFKRPDRRALWFDLVTWPGALCIDGDMGTFVFRRLEDMFEFFRGDSINPGYWSEKVQSTARRGCEQFSEDRFREAIKSQFDSWVEDREPSDAEKAELWSEIDEDILQVIGSEGQTAMAAAYYFHSPEHDFGFVDLFDHRLTEYTPSFLWCCHAIVWGIQQYDAAKVADA